VGTRHRSLRSVATGPLQGVALTLYFVLLPYVIVTKWHFSYTVTNGAVLRDLLVGLALFWLIFLTLLVAYVHQLRHHRLVPANGAAWLAGLIIIALPFLVSASADAATRSTPVAVSTPLSPESPVTHSLAHHGTASASATALFATALAAKGRRDRLKLGSGVDDVDDVDVVARRLHDGDEELVAQLRDVVGSDVDGHVLVTDDAWSAPARHDSDPVVVSLLSARDEALVLGYAREGGSLPVDLDWTPAEYYDRVVGLHEGRVVFAHSDNELVRALARRRDLTTLVVYLGAPSDLDDELRDLCVTVRSASGADGGERRVRPTVRIELLRAYPQVQGLVEDFTPTLRRRCLEMASYLAMHHGEPVTGDRLRTRVLVHAQIDASKTTLSNTASALRRSLGSDAQGLRLEPVSNGLYHLHGVELDVADFHRLVARSRRAPADEAFDLYLEALRLVRGEPLASVTKGFEWFTFEGHRAQLQRDGEWAALALHEAALARDDVETAFWALRQGLLLDPDSDDLADALARVPRLRQFRGDGSGPAQHETVRPGRAVAMSWAFERFGR